MASRKLRKASGKQRKLLGPLDPLIDAVTFRVAEIVGASCEDEQGRGDGAYSLLDLIGTPDEIAAEIAAGIEECDLTNTRDDQALYLNLRIKIRRIAVRRSKE